VRYSWSFAGFAKTAQQKLFASSQPARQRRTKAKLMKNLTRQQKRDIRAFAAKKDEAIDFYDAPLVLDWGAAPIGQFYRPAKKPATIRLDSDVIAWLKAEGRGYQTKANWLLRHAMLHFSTAKSQNDRNFTRRRSKTIRQK
jgi:uncharacterized protein (DUF4415 family)